FETVPVAALMPAHSTTAPLSFWKRISSPPPVPTVSKLLSPTTCQVGPGLGNALMALTVVPVICQRASPPLSFCHRMSASPLPVSNSAAALKCQSGGTAGRGATTLGVLLFMSQRTLSPAWSRQRMSASETATCGLTAAATEPITGGDAPSVNDTE